MRSIATSTDIEFGIRVDWKVVRKKNIAQNAFITNTYRLIVILAIISFGTVAFSNNERYYTFSNKQLGNVSLFRVHSAVAQ